LSFADAQRGYAVGERGVILRTDDGGANWKDVESGVTSNLFAVSAATPDDVIVVGDHGRILRSKNAGQTWEVQPSITSSALFSVAYRGGMNIWVAGRGGAILKRNEPIATVKITAPRIVPILRTGPPKLQVPGDDYDIPLAQPPVRKPARPE
jgi:photosystem II stability/assembly factor-like uncharacterized protein